ncbi:thiamine pyrophosphate-dependent enzyme [Alkaliphilus peptidifermentans]|uniref:Indolepyruvate oxidoreductase subunit IorA n=1 Tax=Alkaliphilus peptidifermentans DSM 18978 TaxID=1120976 RepID=A0A1G5J2F8_9FIRM|nr:thiamine pyrophosphate-dependent enzyme [Alkaliphilus peptidifermentans]SCY82523.1 indolepyruvate ferredoxin oxidoreductase alpha subunit [Alkaliphilus peptidifermentans DSM 18978]
MKEKEKRVLTGNEAISRGFYEAGGIIAASYPGSPTVEVVEKLKEYEEVYSEFSTNEKVALEVAIGGSFYGVRSMAVMKHVGVNIAADPLMTFTQTPINGGFLLISGDDPGLASSQNEQDNRLFAKFANIAVLDPSNSQEAKDYTKLALDISEKFQIPMMLRITSRICHSRSIVSLDERIEAEVKGINRDKDKFCMIPPGSRRAQFFMKERIEKLEEYAYDLEINTLEEIESDTLIITSGMVYQNLKEVNPNASIWKLGLIYPISNKRAKEITAKYNRVIIIEEMMPFIENELKLMGIKCEGKEHFSFTGELDIKDIEAGLHNAGIIKDKRSYSERFVETVPRPPLFCTGCPHRPVFDILKKSKAKTIIGDIGCYSMAFLFPFEQSNIIISMGASIGITKGIKKAMSKKEDNEPLVAVIGDGTFFHSGLPTFVNLLHKKQEGENMTFIVLDNRTTAMTGGQPNASSGLYNDRDDMKVGIKTLLESMGFDRVNEINQYDYKAAAKLFKEEIAYDGLSIIVANGPCALKYNIEEPYYYVDPTICISCRACIKTNCPPLRMIKYEGIEKLKSSIDEDMCVGCSVCAQVCPVNAIKSSKEINREDEKIDN